MRAVILAGGEGTRLRPYTTVLPKPLVPIAGERPFLDYLIEMVSRHGYEEILLLAMRQIIAGGNFFSQSEPQREIKRIQLPGTISKLSIREHAVVQAIKSGIPLVAVANELGINARSITSYRRRALDKLGVKNNAELISLLRLPM